MMTSSGQPLLPLLVPSIKTVFSDPALLSSSFLPKVKLAQEGRGAAGPPMGYKGRVLIAQAPIIYRTIKRNHWPNYSKVNKV